MEARDGSGDWASRGFRFRRSADDSEASEVELAEAVRRLGLRLRYQVFDKFRLASATVAPLSDELVCLAHG